MVALATRFGRYGYRRVTALLRQEGWRVNHKRVERLWRQEGLKVPQRQPKRRRLWLGDGSIVRRRAEHRDHVWSYDFVFDRTADGRPLRLLPIVDEYTRECLSINEEAAIQDCLPDGVRVVLSARAAVARSWSPQSSTIYWLHVRTESGVEGWISHRYVEHE